MALRWAKSLVTVCLLVGFTFNSAHAADDDYSIRTTVDEVRLTLVATDRQHHYINNLSSSEMAIVDNEIIVRKFRSFSRSPEIRLNVLILIDESGSISDRRKHQTATVLDSIRNAAWSNNDSVSVLTFGSSASLLCIRNCGPTIDLPPVAPVTRVALTPLYDAISSAADLLRRSRTPDSKSILIVFSDGNDNYSMRSLPDAIDALQRIDVTAYSVDLNSCRSATPGTATLERLAASTGGLSLSIEDGSAPILDNVLNDLRSAYILTYVPPVQSLGPHNVQVLPTRNLNLTFRSRHGYIYNRVSEEARASR